MLWSLLFLVCAGGLCFLVLCGYKYISDETRGRLIEAGKWLDGEMKEYQAKIAEQKAKKKKRRNRIAWKKDFDGVKEVKKKH